MNSKEQKRTRTVIPADAKVVLEEFYANGMNSKGQKCRDKISEAGDKTGLPLDVVKEWVGNKRKKELRPVPSTSNSVPRPIYTKGVSAYNAFVHEKKAELGGMGTWSAAWNTLSPEQKNAYKAKASELQKTQLPSKTQLLKSICQNIKELSKHGVSAALVGGHPNDGSQILLGTPPAENFFMEREDVLRDFAIYSKDRSNKESVCLPAESDECTKLLRKKAAEHLNTLYKTATGTQKSLPYKRVFSGEILVNGLPESIYPLRFPSHYGTTKLQAILACEKIEVLSQEEYTGTSGDSQACINEEECQEISQETIEETQGVSEEDAAVLLPLFPEVQTKGKKRKARKQQPDSQEYIVEQIMSSKKIKGRQHYLVKWEGFPEEQNTWEPINNIPKNVLDFFLNN